MCLPLAGAPADGGQDIIAAEPLECSGTDSDYTEDSLFVKGDASLLDGLADFISAVPAWSGSQWTRVTLAEGEDAQAAADRLEDSGLFADVQREKVFSLQSRQTGASASGGPEDTHLADMGVIEAWDHLESQGKPRYGSPDVIVAVLDTGTDTEHEALKDRIWTNPGEIPDNGIDDDGNGYVDDVHGWNFNLGEPDVGDTSIHGTHVSGIIAASPDCPCPGVAPGCTLMPLPVMFGNGLVYESVIIEAAEYAVDNGASVLNMSFGYDVYSDVTVEFLEELSRECLVVSAAGNEGCCINPSHTSYHTCYLDPKSSVFGIVGVMNAVQGGAETDDGSNYDDVPYGEYEYDTYAVGVNILSTVPGGGYECLTGTSMSCPIVSGIAALLLTDDPTMTPQELSAAICLSGDLHPYNCIIDETDSLHTLCNAADALTLERRPDLGPYMFRISSGGIEEIVAGTECTLTPDLMNRGFDASDAVCTLSVDDPYVDVIVDRVEFGDVPCTSLAKAPGCFSFMVSEDCPAGHTIELDVTISASGVKDRTFCTLFDVRSYMRLPSVIDRDTVFDPYMDYVFDRDVIVNEGVTAVFGSGCRVIASEKEDGTMPVLTVNGTVRFAGTSDDRITLSSDGGAARIITADPSAEAALEFCDSSGFIFGGDEGICDFRDCKVVCDRFSDDDPVLRIGSALDSSFTVGVREVLIGEMEGSLLVTEDADAVRMDVDGSLYRTQVAVRPCGHHTDFMLAGSVTESVFVALCHGAEGTVTFSAAEGTAYRDVHFGGSLKDMSPFGENCEWQDLPTESIWPFVTDVYLIDQRWHVLGDVIGSSVCFLVMEFSRPVEFTPAATAEFSYDGGRSIRMTSPDMYDPCTWLAYVPSDTISVDLTFALSASGWYAEDEPDKGVPALEGANPVHLDSTANESTQVKAYQQDGGAKIAWAPEDPYHVLSFNVYRYGSPDSDPVFIGNVPFSTFDARTFLIDGTAEAGRTYWYAVNAVGPEGESVMSGRAEVHMHDLQLPVITPEHRGSCMEGKDLKLSFTVTDDSELTCVVLKYRDIGTGKWLMAPLSQDGDRYTATVPGEHVKGDALEYFIWASDPENIAFCGDPDDPMRCGIVAVDGTAIGLSALVLVLLATVPLLFLRRDR